MRTFAILALSAWAALVAGRASAETRSFDEIAAAARGQTVYWNAWAGDESTNRFIAWVGGEAKRRYGVTIEHVKLKDTAEAVTRVLAEKTAGRDSGGTVDLIWINGPNFLSMKKQGLLHGPFTQVLPNYALVDTAGKPSTVTDFTEPVDGLESPWRMAQVVYLYDSERTPKEAVPRSIPAMLAWAKANPGRLTHPTVRNFLGATFLKQALYELVADPSVLQAPATDATFASMTAPLWAWYDELRPHLWREGREFPESGPAQRQLLADGEVDLSISFNPAEAAVAVLGGLLPETTRVYVLDRGTIGNTSFVGIPYNAAHKEGAMVVANLLLDPAVQARAQSPREMGNFTVLAMDKLTPEQRAAFDTLGETPAMPSVADLGRVLLEPHPSWMTRITDEWQRRYTR